jgi:hypothetical protein
MFRTAEKITAFAVVRLNFTSLFVLFLDCDRRNLWFFCLKGLAVSRMLENNHTVLLQS